MPAVVSRSDLVPLAVVVVNLVVLGYGFAYAVHRNDWPAVAGYGAMLCGLYVFFRWWRRAHRAWWWSPEFQARHARFVARLTGLTSGGPYTAWNAGSRQWLEVTACTTSWTAIHSGRRYFEVIVKDAPEPSLASGQDTEFDYITTRCFLVFRRNPRIDIHVTGELVDPRTGAKHPVASARRGSTMRAVVRRLRTPAAARLAGTSDIDSLFDLLDSAEPRDCG